MKTKQWGATAVLCKVLFFATLALVITFTSACTTVAQEIARESIDVSGNWTGECFGCAARAFTLKLTQNGEVLTGTIKTEGAPNFGDDEKSISDGKLSKRKITFWVKGNPGDIFEVELTLSRDGKTMSGYGYYRGSFSLKFTRTN